MEKKAIISIVSNASMEDGDVIEVVSPGNRDIWYGRNNYNFNNKR